MERFPAALLFAARVHDGQRRPGRAVPAIARALGVAALALEHGADEDEAIGALLHDAAEVGGGEAMLAEIRAQFGDAVGDIVLGCSESLVEDPGEKRGWQERKAARVARVAEASPSVCLVLAAAELHAIRAIDRDLRERGEPAWQMQEGGRDGVSWYVDAMSLALWRRWPSTLTGEMRREGQALVEGAGLVD